MKESLSDVMLIEPATDKQIGMRYRQTTEQIRSLTDQFKELKLMVKPSPAQVEPAEDTLPDPREGFTAVSAKGHLNA